MFVTGRRFNPPRNGEMRVQFIEVVQVRSAAVHIPDEVAARRDALAANRQCTSCERHLRDGEKTKVGMCITCYGTTRNYVLRGEITRKELLETGKQLPPTKGGRKPINKFTQQLAERRQ